MLKYKNYGKTLLFSLTCKVSWLLTPLFLHYNLDKTIFQNCGNILSNLPITLIPWCILNCIFMSVVLYMLQPQNTAMRIHILNYGIFGCVFAQYFILYVPLIHYFDSEYINRCHPQKITDLKIMNIMITIIPFTTEILMFIGLLCKTYYDVSNEDYELDHIKI